MEEEEEVMTQSVPSHPLWQLLQSAEPRLDTGHGQTPVVTSQVPYPEQVFSVPPGHREEQLLP